MGSFGLKIKWAVATTCVVVGMAGALDEPADEAPGLELPDVTDILFSWIPVRNGCRHWHFFKSPLATLDQDLCVPAQAGRQVLWTLIGRNDHSEQVAKHSLHSC